MKTLSLAPLDADRFRPFGEVIETDNASEIKLINGGTTTRYHDIAPVDVSTEDGRPLISIFRGKPFEFPIRITMMERHPLGSQAFMPLAGNPFVVVVAPDRDGQPGEPSAFLAEAGQGVSYHRNVWHHPLISLREVSDFLVVDRGGDGTNLEEADYDSPYEIAG